MYPTTDSFRANKVGHGFADSPGTRHPWRISTRAVVLALLSCLVLTTGATRVDAQITTAPETKALLKEIQQAGVRYFYDFGHPVSGLAREYSDRSPDICTIGATGMGFFNLIVASERGFITRTQAAERAQLVLGFLSTKADRFHGVFPHWLNGQTGKTIPFAGKDDNGGDLVETAFLAEGLLALREYFTEANPVEKEVRTLADKIWREIEWDWHTKDNGPVLLWHWSPTVGFKKNHQIRGFNECHIVYLLALGSPTHPVPANVYWQGWQGAGYSKEREDFGIRMSLGRDMGMPLFFTHFSYLGFDPHALSFKGKTYFEHFQDMCRVQVAYAQSKKDTFKGYGPLWGLTASQAPDGYRAFAPGPNDNGTIAPTAALASMPYLPEASISFLQKLNWQYKEKLWGPYGFKDALNPSRNWVANGYLGIDVGPIAPMIENHLSGLCWNTFMKAPEIRVTFKRLRETEPKT